MVPTSKLIESCRKWFTDTFSATLINLWIDCASPKPAPRPQITRFGGSFYPSDYRNFKAKLASDIKALLPEHERSDTRSYFLFLEFVCPPYKTSKSPFPKGDVDNLSKPPMDAITDIETLWADDKQVVGVCAFKRFAVGDEPTGYRIYISYAEE